MERQLRAMWNCIDSVGRAEVGRIVERCKLVQPRFNAVEGVGCV